MCKQIRDQWVRQQRYTKFMEQAEFLWNQFTGSFNNSKIKKQEELEEKLKKEAAEKMKRHQDRVRQQKRKIKEEKQKEEEMY